MTHKVAMVFLPIVVMFAVLITAIAESCGGEECAADNTDLMQRKSSQAKVHKHAAKDTSIRDPPAPTNSSVPISDAGCATENPCIPVDEVLAAQVTWCDALVNISMTYESKGIAAAKATAEEVIDTAYGYNYGPVLFKPTLATGEQTFRPTKEGALSYFVGNDPNFPDDDGFALKGWRTCEADNQAIYLDIGTAIVQGWVHMTDKDGAVTTVDKTFGYRKGEDGSLRIILHHSSLPYVA
mmetsp:Transcript_86248/g.184877  ORF Transcript_86248/g.184877 Transcript_86248/m.184877 type:complete len:239 (+) Transcript_86248:83-799(+)